MRAILKGVMVAAGAALLASCAVAPTPQPAPVAVVTPKQLPYRWTQGNAPQAHKDAVAVFGPLFLRPGQFLWRPTFPRPATPRS